MSRLDKPFQKIMNEKLSNKPLLSITYSDIFFVMREAYCLAKKESKSISSKLKWVSIKQKLPPDAELLSQIVTVITYCENKERGVAGLLNGRWIIQGGNYNVTHWMHFPQSPINFSKDKNEKTYHPGDMTHEAEASFWRKKFYDLKKENEALTKK